MRKRTSVDKSIPIRVAVVTLDAHLATGFARARASLRKRLPGLELGFHVATEWQDHPAALEACRADIERADIIVTHMLFMEDHIQAILPWLERRADDCDAMIGCMSAQEVVQLTRMGRFRINGDDSSLLSRIKNFARRNKKDDDAAGPPRSAGAKQAAMLRRIPQLLRFVPGTAQDLRAYLLTMQYWLAGSEENVEHMITFLIDRYAKGPRKGLRGGLPVSMPVEYPSVGLFHPDLPDRIVEAPSALPKARARRRATVGLLLMRSYVLARNTAHYEGVIRALEARGLRVLPAFSSGLDARPAIERYFLDGDRACVDAVVSLTGFSLIGGPAYSDPTAAEEILSRLDVPYLAAQAVEFESLEGWAASDAGLSPIETTMMVAIPELDGATGPIVFGGHSDAPRQALRDVDGAQDMVAHEERAERLAHRVDALVSLRHGTHADRKLGIVLFNFPPNAGNTGTAMHLSVFESLYNTLVALRDDGYTVEVPVSVDALRECITEGNARQLGTHANVQAKIPVDQYVMEEPYLDEIEAEWGAAPGRDLTDSQSIFVLGARFGNVCVVVQPGSGYDGDPMRMLFEKGLAPTHAFSAFYRYLRDDFGADALLHYGTHGSLEFMPGKQVGLSETCWPDRLIGDVPNFYLYTANNPSEGVIARRRSAATLISYLTPPIEEAGLYRGLSELKDSIARWRSLSPQQAKDPEEGGALLALIRDQAQALDLVDASETGFAEPAERVLEITRSLEELEETLIPVGLHVVGQPPNAEQRLGLLGVAARGLGLDSLPESVLTEVAGGATLEHVVRSAEAAGCDAESEPLAKLVEANRLLSEDHEIPALLRALDGRFVRPAPSGDLVRTVDILPTGRNVHGFDPFRLPSRFALHQGTHLADRLLDRYRADGHDDPESVALVLWGSDNLKTEGASIAQALALLGARPRLDSYGRVCGAELIPQEELGRPRIDVVMTLSGIFRDLFPIQVRMLAEAAKLAAVADEPVDRNFVRKHALADVERHGVSIEEAALRVFSNAVGASGAHVSALVQDECWNDEDELAEAFQRRKSFAYGCDGEPTARPELLERALAGVDLAYQNLDSVELGVTSVDIYFDNLGGVSRAISRASGKRASVYIGDQTQGGAEVRTLQEQVALEARARVLNPKWFEGMLEHGYEGVRELESHVTNTLGWSATTGQVDEWVYERIANTFLLDEEMRKRLAELNPVASTGMASRLLEAQERNYWSPDDETLEALRAAESALEDNLEGIHTGVEAA
ncbi:MAG: magnesium chelatase subunit H [Myxococcota bacterium]